MVPTCRGSNSGATACGARARRCAAIECPRSPADPASRPSVPTPAHPDPEVALFRAVAETIQGRAAFIAGSRDDLLPSHYAEAVRHLKVAFAMPLPDGMDGVDFRSVAPASVGAAEMEQAIKAAGLGPVIVFDLGVVGPFHVVRAIACGLGARKRRRRVAA